MNRFDRTEQKDPAAVPSASNDDCNSWRALVGEPDDRWDPKIAKFYHYWKSIRPDQGLPGRQHIDATDIPDLLAQVWLIDVEYLSHGCRFRYRLMGTAIVSAMGRELTGAYLDDIEGAQAPRLRRYKQMLATQQPTYRKGQVGSAGAARLGTEEIVVPLARDGRIVDMLMGCAVFFRMTRDLPSTGDMAADLRPSRPRQSEID